MGKKLKKSTKKFSKVCDPCAYNCDVSFNLPPSMLDRPAGMMNLQNHLSHVIQKRNVDKKFKRKRDAKGTVINSPPLVDASLIGSTYLLCRSFHLVL